MTLCSCNTCQESLTSELCTTRFREKDSAVLLPSIKSCLLRDWIWPRIYLTGKRDRSPKTNSNKPHLKSKGSLEWYTNSSILVRPKIATASGSSCMRLYPISTSLSMLTTHWLWTSIVWKTRKVKIANKLAIRTLRNKRMRVIRSKYLTKVGNPVSIDNTISLKIQAWAKRIRPDSFSLFQNSLVSTSILACTRVTSLSPWTRA